MRQLCQVFLAVLLVVAPCWAQGKLPRPSFPIKVELDSLGSPVISWPSPEEQVPRQRTLLRSTTDLRTTKDAKAFPIASFDMNFKRPPYTDQAAPQDVELFYQLKVTYRDGRTTYSNVARVKAPAPRISALQKPSLLVDKRAYTLTVLDQGAPVRRFPIALGDDPSKRKVHFDRASTPEGIYKICGVQPKATFYRAYDLDYPNEVDRARYQLLAEKGQLPNPAPHIGGEIQIHGHGIDSNWTWGCIALRDTDMDQLFGLPALAHGVTVLIAGSEITPEDLQSELRLSAAERQTLADQLVALRLASGRSPRHLIYGLCRYQAKNGLMMTGLFDVYTRATLAHKRRRAKKAVR